VTTPPNPEKLLTTLEQLPPHHGIVFRGCDATSHQQWPGRTLVTQGILAASSDPRVATQNFTTDALYAILTRTARAIEQFSSATHEREVVILPGTVLTQVTRDRFGDLPITIVEEFDPENPDTQPIPLEEVRARIASALHQAEATPNLTQPIRDRFIGDIN
jgi:hypothetical protein